MHAIKISENVVTIIQFVGTKSKFNTLLLSQIKIVMHYRCRVMFHDEKLIIFLMQLHTNKIINMLSSNTIFKEIF